MTDITEPSMVVQIKNYMGFFFRVWDFFQYISMHTERMDCLKIL